MFIVHRVYWSFLADVLPLPCIHSLLLVDKQAAKAEQAEYSFHMPPYG